MTGQFVLHCFTKDNETTDDTPSIITGDTYNLYLDTSVLQLGQTYAPQLQMRQVGCPASLVSPNLNFNESVNSHMKPPQMCIAGMSLDV